MLFQSTRGNAPLVSGTAAVLRGIAPDGGLYLPQNGKLPAISVEDLLQLSTCELAVKVLHTLLPDFSEEEMQGMVNRAYSGRFETEDLTPVVPVGDNYVLELFRGPTSAFKDVALCMLPQLITEARKKEQVQEEIVILTATSGDTGKAALEGFHDVPGTRIIVFYPEEGVSCVQKAQMTTQTGNNVTVCAVKGNFDDAQTGVKYTFNTCDAEHLLDGKAVTLSSANSINIGRLIPQTVYYFRAYSELVKSGRIHMGEEVDYVVPTGNFGDILAGYFAKEMGLPVGRLICASNKNDVLTEFLQTGVYNKKREFYKTTSPSMDILISSNLERLLYLASGDTAKVAAWMKQLSEEGEYRVDSETLQKIQAIFSAGCCNEDETGKAIAEVWNNHHYLMDTHTAVAWKVAEEYKAESGRKAPVVVLSTASAYKFPAAVLHGLGQQPDADEFKCLAQLEALTGVRAPEALRTVGEKEVLHKDVIGRDEILSYVLRKIGD